MYQRYRVGEPNRSNTTVPNMCLVVAQGATYASLSLGLGSVHPNCRVSHYGTNNIDSKVAWTDTSWTSYTSAAPNYMDESINLDYLFPQLDAGASVSLSWAYMLTAADLVTGLTTMSSVTITQPSTTGSGSSVAFGAVVSFVASSVTFSVMNGTSVR